MRSSESLTVFPQRKCSRLKLAYLAASIAITMIECNGGHAIEIKEIHKVAPSFTDK